MGSNKNLQDILKDFVGGVTDNWKDLIDDLINRNDDDTSNTSNNALGALTGLPQNALGLLSGALNPGAAGQLLGAGGGNPLAALNMLTGGAAAANPLAALQMLGGGGNPMAMLSALQGFGQLAGGTGQLAGGLGQAAGGVGNVLNTAAGLPGQLGHLMQMPQQAAQMAGQLPGLGQLAQAPQQAAQTAQQLAGGIPGVGGLLGGQQGQQQGGGTEGKSQSS
ncbi:hypothetical protein [Streptomyces flavalbus]|uniref:Uncharacterized protein n=1 Tax=Streptomyces flavalbus TaxID=2665155 RepID=A0ABW2W346_9ACTN